MYTMNNTHSEIINRNSDDKITDPLSILRETRFEACQVCGEQSSGLHCGAITCEACKKFFLRSTNGEDQKYKCLKNKNCIITRNTRTQCQFCRFEKCKNIGMNLKENYHIENLSRVTDIFAEISCYVCQAASSGIHFGAITCEGCKGFFRRSIKERTPTRYKCLENGHCRINESTRNACRYCRFQRCIQVGMSVEASRIGRQSNLFKHHMRLVFEKTNPNINIDNENREFILKIYQSYKETLDNLPVCGHLNDSFLSCMNQFKIYANRLVKFAIAIPNFLNISNVNDQIQLIKSSIHTIIILCLHRLNKTFQMNYFHIEDWRIYKDIQQLFPFIDYIQYDTNKFQQSIESLKLDDHEFSLFLCVILVSTNNNFQFIDSIQTELAYKLSYYMDKKRGTKNRDFYKLMSSIPLLRNFNVTVKDYIRDQIPKNVEYPIFFSKVYL